MLHFLQDSPPHAPGCAREGAASAHGRPGADLQRSSDRLKLALDLIAATDSNAGDKRY